MKWNKHLYSLLKKVNNKMYEFYIHYLFITQYQNLKDKFVEFNLFSKPKKELHDLKS